MKFRFIAPFIATLLINSQSLAVEPNNKAAEFVNKNANQVINILERSTKSDEKKKDLVNLFMNVMDYDWMAKFVIGKYWNTLSGSERLAYQSIYRDYIVSIYVPKYADYNHQQYKITRASNVSDDQYIVSMEIHPKNSQPVKVDYRIKDYGGYMKVRDIIAEDISLITTQRADFTAFLSTKSINDLISSLEQKIRKS